MALAAVWVNKLKRAHRITSRKITKFITQNFKTFQKFWGEVSALSLPLRGGSTRLKITWVQQRQHHRAHENARERMVSLALRNPRKMNVDKNHIWARSSTQVWALCSETRALREADISWFRHVASAKRACSLGMRCVTLAARDSCAIFVSLAHGPVPPQRRGLWWTKWEKTASLRARNVLWY